MAARFIDDFSPRLLNQPEEISRPMYENHLFFDTRRPTAKAFGFTALGIAKSGRDFRTPRKKLPWLYSVGAGHSGRAD